MVKEALSDEALGQEALRRKLITAEQLRDALAEQAREVSAGRPKPRPLSNILVSRGYLTPQQFSELASPTPESRYSVREEIARGGMGAILRVSERAIRRDVAMKVMLEDSGEEARARFLEEAQVTGQLEHPNIIPVHELGTDTEGRLYFTMKLVKGRSLAQALKERGSDPGPGFSRLLNVFVNVCNALAFSHSRGVVHRDLKPANIMLGDFGEVLVMDWGLAKIGAARRSTGRFTASEAGSPAADERLAEGIRSLREESGGSQTLDGAVMGTPHYMPPEQAAGDLGRINERSDIYSLGAILYEILTRHPPVEGKTLQEVLRKAAEGSILPPAARAPGCTVPPELSAIAMKALAKNPDDRYARVEDLRRDVELHLEGRAVSAKQDTALEALVKLVRRNKGASLATTVAAVVLLGVVAASYGINLRARRQAEANAIAAESERSRADAERRKAERALTDFKSEEARRIGGEQARTLERRKSAPLFLASGQKAILAKDYDGALLQLEVAATYDPGLPEPPLLRAQILATRQNYPAAARELEAYLRLVPADADAGALLELCRQAGTERAAEVSALVAEVLKRQRAYALAEDLVQSSAAQLDLQRRRLHEVWPRWHPSNLYLGPDGLLLNLKNIGEISDLGPLAGLPLKALWLGGTAVVDLTPLKGLPLVSLELPGDVRDLRPLRGMKLKEIQVHGKVVDFSPLEGMPVASFSATANRHLGSISFLKDAPLKSFRMEASFDVDLRLLREKPLTSLALVQYPWPKDPGFFERMPLESVDASFTDLSDLRPLQGKPLKHLLLRHCGVKDLSPLQGMPLERLQCENLPLSDLSALRSLPLRQVTFNNCPGIADVSPLRDLKLDSLILTGTGVKDLDPLSGAQIAELTVPADALERWGGTVLSLRGLKQLHASGERACRMTMEEFRRQWDEGLWRPSVPILKWKILGPFDPSPPPSLDAEVLELRSEFRDMHGKSTGWREPRRMGPSGFVELKQDFTPTDRVSAYMMTELESASERQIELVGGRDDSIVLWLNGKKLFQDSHPVSYSPRGFVVPAALKSGRNVIVVRCTNFSGYWEFSLRHRPAGP